MRAWGAKRRVFASVCYTCPRRSHTYPDRRTTEDAQMKAVPELAGLAEVAALLHVSKRTASRYTERPDFPEPLQRLASGPIWSANEVSRWADQHLPFAMGWKKGQPRRT